VSRGRLLWAAGGAALLATFPGRAAAQASAARPVLLPEGDVFLPLVADPKQPQFLAAVARVRSSLRTTTVGAAAFGEDIGTIR
jgi:hypothetical protein